MEVRIAISIAISTHVTSVVFCETRENPGGFMRNDARAEWQQGTNANALTRGSRICWRRTLARGAMASLLILTMNDAFGAGYEKNIMWSGRHGGQAGASLSTVEGSEALYWNPAGLVSSRLGHDVTLNLSPTYSRFQGSISSDGENRKSDEQYILPFGLMYGSTRSEKWGWGIGSYASGGTTAKYENVPIGAFTLRPTIESKIQLIEVAAGAGYRVNEQWQLGVAWRAGFVSAKLSSAAATAFTVPAAGVALTASQIDDLEGEELVGLKLGAQYRPSEVWGLGLSFRTEYDFELDGTATGQRETTLAPGSVTTLAGGPATVKSRFPMQLNFGGHWNIVPDAWRAYAEYGFTQYSRVKTLEINATLSGAALPNIAQNWKDQHHVRLAGEFLRTNWPVRFGYVFTSQVVPESDARATFSAPGTGHTLTLGTGRDVMADRLHVDMALESSWITGDVSPTASPAQGGDYETIGYALHLGAAYLF
ncbi:MAG: outer membrane protein transport protein [Bdellovibrionaceae bacterium]|nr:outer membrane protein transport protein [Pseudobdellovibrionaceae bacterium]